MRTELDAFRRVIEVNLIGSFLMARACARAMVEAGATWDWPEYQPHISIQVGGNVDLSKVEPYQGKIVLGPEIFEELRED